MFSGQAYAEHRSGETADNGKHQNENQPVWFRVVTNIGIDIFPFHATLHGETGKGVPEKPYGEQIYSMIEQADDSPGKNYFPGVLKNIISPENDFTDETNGHKIW